MSKTSDAGDTFLPEAPEKDIQQANDNKNTVGEEPGQGIPDGTTANRVNTINPGSDNCTAVAAFRNRARRDEDSRRTDSREQVYAAHHAWRGMTHE